MAELELPLTWVQGLLLLLPTGAITTEPGTKSPSRETESKLSAQKSKEMLVPLMGTEILPKPVVFIYLIAPWVFLNDILIESHGFL